MARRTDPHLAEKDQPPIFFHEPAGFLGVNVNTVRSWEQGKRLPQPLACRFLAEIEADPAYWRRRVGHESFEAESRERDVHQ